MVILLALVESDVTNTLFSIVVVIRIVVTKQMSCALIDHINLMSCGHYVVICTYIIYYFSLYLYRGCAAIAGNVSTSVTVILNRCKSCISQSAELLNRFASFLAACTGSILESL